MHKNIKIIFILLLISFVSCSKKIQLTGNLSQDCNQILKDGNYNAKIYEEVFITNSRYDEINSKLIAAIQLNYDWFVEYSKKNTTPLPYHENFGVSEEDYDYFLNYDHSNTELKETSEAQLKISNKNNRIVFNGNNNLEFMDRVEINLKDSTILMVNNRLLFDGYIIVDSTNNVFNSRWKGYHWQFAEGVKYENLNDDNLNMKYYSITIGYLEDKEKTFMIIEGKQIDNGELVVDFSTLIILEKL